MTNFSPEFKQKVIREELDKLEKEKYISKAAYQEVLDAHHKYYKNVAQTFTKKESNQIEREVQKDTAIPVKKKSPVKKVLSPQEIRDRNITWLLNLGVVLLLLGGLVLATSTWETLADWMKTSLIALVSIMFYGLAYFTRRILRIEKTAFAFYILGSLFLPIVILSAMFFGLFGSYFSLTGEGRFLYGAIGSLVVLPIYILLSIRLASRLFVWFSYIIMSVFVGFLIATLYLPINQFYFGIMLFNGGLMIAYHYLKNKDGLQRFTNEFVPYIQANLVLSTIMMLIFYDNELMYSFNLFLTAAIYFAMIFVTNYKKYHFVFSAMLVYGAYQLIEFSALANVDTIAYALLGFIFLLFPIFITNSTSLQKAFQYTSAIVSGSAFLYITLQGILLRINDPSIILLIAYVIISLNFTFLANMVKGRLFYYLSPVFLTIALAELILLGQTWFGHESFILPMFIGSSVLYIIVGCLVNISFLQNIKESSRDVNLTVMLGCLYIGLLWMNWWHAGTMLFLFSIISIFMDQFEDRKLFTESALASWLHPITLGLSATIYYSEWIGNSYIELIMLKADSLVIGSIVVFMASLVWKFFKRKTFDYHVFLVAQFFYGFAILHIFDNELDDFLRVFIAFGGVVMAYLLYQRTKWTAMPYVVSSLSLLSYLTLLYAVDLPLYDSLQLVIGAVLLLLVGVLMNTYDSNLTGAFWWMSHLYLPLAVFFSLLLSIQENTVWAFTAATIIYGFSLMRAKEEWMVKTFLYAFFTSFWLTICLYMTVIELQQHVHYAFLITSVMIAILWFISKELWMRRIAYYLVPFSILGIMTISFADPQDLTLFIVTSLYTVGLLLIMHREKWDIFNVIPLLIVYNALIMFEYGNMDTEYGILSAVTRFAIILTATGLMLYRKIWIKEKNRVHIDWYSIVGFIAIMFLYTLNKEALWAKVLPGLLITVNLILQRNRIPQVSSKWLVYAACLYLLQPYYKLLGHIEIPSLIERELYVLPWVVFVILLRKVSDKKYKSIINYVQWAVLIIVSLLLIQDAMSSSTVYDALIIGVLALAAILGGMAYQIKSFFFVGIGVLLLNVFLQTRPYWGHLPWWAYLLIAGSILITVASYNEWHKQKTADGKETLVSKFKNKLIDKINKWE